MSQVITKRVRLSRRTFLKGLTAARRRSSSACRRWFRCSIRTGTAYAADTPAGEAQQAIEKRFVLWFNGNGIPERYWIPAETGADYDMTPCLTPLAPFRRRHPRAERARQRSGYGPGNGHPHSMCALMTCTRLTGRGPGGPSIDQVLAAQDRRRIAFPFAADRRLAGIVRRRMQNNMSWAGYDRPLPPEMIPHRCSTACSARGTRAGSIASGASSTRCAAGCRRAEEGLPKEDEARLDEHLSSIRDLERAIASLPPDYQQRRRRRKKTST